MFVTFVSFSTNNNVGHKFSVIWFVILIIKLLQTYKLEARMLYFAYKCNVTKVFTITRTVQYHGKKSAGLFQTINVSVFFEFFFTENRILQYSAYMNQFTIYQNT